MKGGGGRGRGGGGGGHQKDTQESQKEKERTVRLCRKRWEKKETKKDSDGEIVCEERRDYVEIVRELGCRDCQCGGGGSLVELQTYIFFVKQGGRWEVKNPPSAQLWKLTDKLFCLD